MLIYPYFLAVLSFSAGSIAHFAMAPYNAPPALLIAFPLLYFALKKSESLTSKFIYTWLFAFGYFLFGLSWIGNALLVPGNEEFLWAYPLAVAGLPALLSFFPAICITYLTRHFDYERIDGWFAFVFAFSVSELARTFLFTGFPWNSYGYTWVAYPEVMQIASVGGICFTTTMTILWASLPALFLLYRFGPAEITTSIVALSLFIASFYWGHQRLSQTPIFVSKETVVHMIQPNVKQELKWRPDLMQEHFKSLVTLTENALEPYADKTIIVVWPETATVTKILNTPSATKDLTKALKTSPKNRLLTGILRRKKSNNKYSYHNSLAVLSPELDYVNIYDKHHLVPFGEYIPFQEYIPLTPIVKFSGFQSGPGPRVIVVEKEVLITPLICYEAIFSRNIFPTNALSSTLLVNVTNDAWYGNSAGPRQHMVQSIFRAVESGKPIIRVANTGISIIADPLGRILRSIPLETKNSASYALPHPLKNKTHFAKMGWQILAFTLLLLFGIAYISKKR